ncbi:MAG TPA: tripartite tricarboxylate transporter substrate-binding protein [Burkholderiales bacterium]|nr:tripartite tricarboxylate transporter substrate-binding protein [Burkholderiales bacterium]
MNVRTLWTCVMAVLAWAASATHAAETSFPDRPIRLVIGSAAGSGPDIISRVLAERLYKSWGQRVVVDARPGVAGILSAELVLRSAADGYTWMMLTSQLMVATSVYPDVKFDLDKGFVSVSLIGSVPFVQLIHPELPAKSIRELIDLAKKQPGMLRYGSAGAGASEHLSGFLFTRLTGTNMLHVPYKGIPQAIADTLAKEVHLTYPVLPAALPHVQSGRLRALGVTTPKRATLLPDVPAIGEVVPGYQMMGWYSIVVPRGTPEPILAKVSSEVAAAVREPAFGEQLKGLGLEIAGTTRAELDAFRRDQRKRITEIVKASGVDLK